MSNVLLGPGATGIVGAAGGATHAAKHMTAAKALSRAQQLVTQQPLHRFDLGRRIADPERQGRSIDRDALPRQNPGLR